ncbi:MAG: hypothetical protein HYV09_26570 [Deltaproteobacteria bacterium]|nr:hypothetical protein [Deltaproteobacteria bacterium]
MIDAIDILANLYRRARFAHGPARDVLLAEARIVILNSRLPAADRRALLEEHTRLAREVRP